MTGLDGVYVYPLEFSLDGRRSTVTAVAIECERGLVLLDTGVPDSGPALARGLKTDGFTTVDVDLVVLSHQDIDHAGGTARIVADAGAPVLAHARDAPAIRGDEPLLKSSPERPRSYPSVTVDVELQDGERVHTAAGPLEVIHTPGHTPGHLSFLLGDHGLLISGDALYGRDGLALPSSETTPDMARAMASVRKLATFDVDRVLCSHGGLVDAGSSEIEALLEG